MLKKWTLSHENLSEISNIRKNLLWAKLSLDPPQSSLPLQLPTSPCTLSGSHPQGACPPRASAILAPPTTSKPKCKPAYSMGCKNRLPAAMHRCPSTGTHEGHVQMLTIENKRVWKREKRFPFPSSSRLLLKWVFPCGHSEASVSCVYR